MGLSWSGIKESASSIANKASVAREKIASSKAAGYASDTVAAGYGVGLHTLGGAAMGGTINAAAYADDGHALTSAESLGSAFVSGAGYGGAAGLGLGLVHARKYATYNASKRAKSLKQSTLTHTANELPDPAKVRTPIGMREEQLATDRRRQRMLEENGAGLMKYGAAKDENARNNAATLAQRQSPQNNINANPELVQPTVIPQPTIKQQTQAKKNKNKKR